jgi:hypothetical protein
VVNGGLGSDKIGGDRMGRGGEDGWNQQRGAEGNRKRIEYGCVGIRQLSCMGWMGSIEERRQT